MFKNLSPFATWSYKSLDLEYDDEESLEKSPQSSSETLFKLKSISGLRLTISTIILLLTASLGFFAGRFSPALFPSNFLMGTKFLRL
jgi:hypothetical protein